MIGLTGSDVLDIVEAAERKHPGRDEILTLLSAALSLVALHHGVPKSVLIKGVEASYRQTRKLAPNTAAKSDTKQPH